MTGRNRWSITGGSWAEKEGTMTNADRRISYLNKITAAPGEALPDAEILCRFAQKMGYEGFNYKNAGEIYAEHCALTEGTNIDISGLGYDILKNNNIPYSGLTKNNYRQRNSEVIC